MKLVNQAQILGLSNAGQRATAERILGVDALGRGRFEQALTYFDNGFAIIGQAAETRQTTVMKAYFQSMRADVFSQQSQNEAAIAALEQAIHYVKAAGADSLIPDLQQRIERLG